MTLPASTYEAFSANAHGKRGAEFRSGEATHLWRKRPENRGRVTFPRVERGLRIQSRGMREKERADLIPESEFALTQLGFAAD